MTLLSLRAGRIAVDLAPQAGGTIARFSVDDSDLLRPMPPEAIASGLGSQASCYPLVPFSNRIADGRLTVDGREYVLPANSPGQRHPIHGEGWLRRWDVARHDARSAELIDRYEATGGWPFRYQARQTFRLEPDGLFVTMAIDNLEDHAVPAGLGLHPFFMKDDDTELAFQAGSVWLGDEEVLPTERIAVPADWNYATLRKVAAGLDNCFDGWDGRASIVWPRRRLRLELQASTPFRHTVVYTPGNRPYFCVEPVSHANGQVGKSVLAAGATLLGDIAFHLSTL
jgi:aldose 1-epimerase